MTLCTAYRRYGMRIDMTRIEDIEKAVEQLSPQDLAKFREWFEEFDARLFDAKIERDAKAGKLDTLMAEARANHDAGRRSRSGEGRNPVHNAGER
jgi:hypothetical protein